MLAQSVAQLRRAQSPTTPPQRVHKLIQHLPTAGVSFRELCQVGEAGELRQLTLHTTHAPEPAPRTARCAPPHAIPSGGAV
jgi:hypothetical protein